MFCITGYRTFQFYRTFIFNIITNFKSTGNIDKLPLRNIVIMIFTDYIRTNLYFCFQIYKKSFVTFNIAVTCLFNLLMQNRIERRPHSVLPTL